MNKNTKIIGHDGPSCRRCGEPTQIREHERVTPKELRRHFYYSRWYRCVNKNCRTTEIMPDEFRVWNNAAAARVHESVTTPAPPHRDIALEVLAGERPPWE